MINLFDKFKSYIPVTVYLKKRKNGDFLIVMNEKTEIFYLNDTAHFIYESIDGKATVFDLFAKLKEEYDFSEITESDVKKDLVEMIRDFQWQGIVKLKEVK